MIENTNNIISNIKNKYYSLYLTKIDDYMFIWKPITKIERETSQLLAENNELNYEENICNYSIIYTNYNKYGYNSINFNTIDAGIPSLLAPLILKESGYETIDKFKELITSARNNMMTNYITQMETVVASIFPQYKFEDMNKWNLEQLVNIVARAEYVITVLHGMETPFNSEEKIDTESDLTEAEKLRLRESELIEKGQDPITILGSYYISKYITENPVIEIPIIVGNSIFNNETLIEKLYKQINVKKDIF